MHTVVMWLVIIFLGVLGGESSARDLEEILKQKGVLSEKEVSESRAEPSVAPALPDWVKKLTLSGDIRVRNETFFRDGDPDRIRQRFRLRLGAKAAVNEETEIGMKLASGDGDDPISNNQTFTDVFTFKEINITNGYLKLAPAKSLGMARPYVTLLGGKFDTPTYVPTKLVLDGDLTPEGFFEALHLVSAKEGFLRLLQVNLGQWVAQELSKRGDGAIFVFQAVGGMAFSDRVSANVGVGDYVFHKPSTIAGARNTSDKLVVTNKVVLADGSRLGGRKIDPAKDGQIAALVSDFNLLNAGTDFTVDTGSARWPLKLFGDYVRNTGAEGGQDTGFEVGAGIGAVKEPKDLNFVYAYERLETDAVMSTITDSDFGRDGATNTQGHILQLNYVLLKGLQFSSTAFITEPIENVAGRNSKTDYRWQVDLIAKF